LGPKSSCGWCPTTGIHFWVHGEPSPNFLYTKKGEVLWRPRFVSSFTSTHNSTIASCEKWIANNQFEKMFCCQIWDGFFSLEHRCKDPLTFYHFFLSLDCVEKYIDLLKFDGIRWIGLKFDFTILWHPMKSEDEFWATTNAIQIICWDIMSVVNRGTQHEIGVTCVSNPHLLYLQFQVNIMILDAWGRVIYFVGGRCRVLEISLFCPSIFSTSASFFPYFIWRIIPF